MANFNWAYIDCSSSAASDGGAYGPTGSVQFMSGSGNTSGSAKFLYYSASAGGYAANTLVLTGTLVVSGTVSASHYHIENVTEIDVSGSTFFGNTNDDVHIRTGSMYVGEVSKKPTFGVSATLDRVTVKGFAGQYTPVTASLFTSSNGDYLIGVQTASNVEMRIHAATTALSGAILMIKDEVTSRVGVITISSSGGTKIDGQSFYQLSGSHPAISLYSNGANWFVY